MAGCAARRARGNALDSCITMTEMHHSKLVCGWWLRV
jgi:hypothetical protein